MSSPSTNLGMADLDQVIGAAGPAGPSTGAERWGRRAAAGGAEDDPAGAAAAVAAWDAGSVGAAAAAAPGGEAAGVRSASTSSRS